MTAHHKQPRSYRSYTTSEIVVSLARYGVAIETMARALVVSAEQVEASCRRAIDHGTLERMPPMNTDNPREALYTEVVNLRADVLDLKNKIASMNIPSDDVAWSLKCHFGLTVYEGILLAALMKHGQRTKPQLYHLCYGARNADEQPDPKIIEVFVCKLRAKLKPHGIAIGTVWGMGYSMTAPEANKVRALVDGLGEQVPQVESPPLAPAAA